MKAAKFSGDPGAFTSMVVVERDNGVCRQCAEQRGRPMYEEQHVARYAHIWDGLDPQDHAELRRIAADDGHLEPSSALVARFTDAGGIAIPVSWEGAPGDMITRLDAGFLRWVHTAHRHVE